MTTETIKTPSGFRNIDINVPGANQITVFQNGGTPESVTFDAIDPVGTIKAAGSEFFVINVGSAIPTPIPALPDFSNPQVEFVESVLVKPVSTRGPYTIFSYEVRYRRIDNSSGAAFLTPLYITVNGNDIALPDGQLITAII